LSDFFLSIQISSNNVISLYKGVQFSLQVFILLGQKKWVFLESLVLRFKIKISIH
jgi:hypothetical protein